MPLTQRQRLVTTNYIITELVALLSIRCHLPRQQVIIAIKNLANLDQLAGKRFTFIGFPLRIRGGTGSPVRAVALFKN